MRVRWFRSSIPLLCAVLLIGARGRAQQPPLPDRDAEPIFGLPAPDLDLRTMLRRHLIDEGVRDLAEGSTRRNQAMLERQIPVYGQKVRDWVAASLGPMPFGRRGGPLRVRPVSKFTRKGYALENLIFESYPGWEVNATVYLPLPETFAPPWTAMVMPVGHCSKTDESVQVPAQIFARNGYLVITFDPPGFGEKSVGNDHFNDGVRCYLTGTTSQRFFLMDALRAIDYLATRPDVDTSHGVGMTGVSGGGVTTLYCTLLDKRIKAAAPSCFTSPEAYNPLRNGYALCPEPMPIGRYRQGIQTIDLLVGAYPTPLLLMAGKFDTLFLAEWSQAAAGEVVRAYEAGGVKDHFDFYLDDSPHAYTAKQALRAIAWMDRWVRGIPGRQLVPIGTDDLEMAPREVLQCHPRAEENIYSVNRREAEQLATQPRTVPIRTAAMKLVGLDEERLQRLRPMNVKSATPFKGLGGNSLEELSLISDAGVQLPATLLYERRPKSRTPAILYFDDRGRWTDLGSNGMLVGMSHVTAKDGKNVAILTVDLRGWGDTRPSYDPYEIYGWGAPQRWLAYVSAALADPVLAMRIRDGLTALAYLRLRAEIDPEQIVLGGHGMGGVVALHVAEIDGHVRGVFCSEMLSSFQALAASPSYTWDHDAFFPNVLKYYDLPELAGDLRAPLLIVNPLDAMKRPLLPEAARQLYAQALARANVSVQPGLAGPQAQGTQVNWVDHLWQDPSSMH